jgi:gentisate 1,2-dioxygenase
MYTSPLTGGWAIPTMATWMQMFPRGLSTLPYRSTDGTVFCVVEGEGHSVIDGKTFEWGVNDIFAVPSWKAVEHHAASDAVVFGYSDRATQERLGMWREERIER